MLIFFHIASNQLLLHLRQELGQGQERVGADDYECGEDGVDKYVGDVLREGAEGLGVWREGQMTRYIPMLTIVLNCFSFFCYFVSVKLFAHLPPTKSDTSTFKALFHVPILTSFPFV